MIFDIHLQNKVTCLKRVSFFFLPWINWELRVGCYCGRLVLAFKFLTDVTSEHRFKPKGKCYPLIKEAFLILIVCNKVV